MNQINQPALHIQGNNAIFFLDGEPHTANKNTCAKLDEAIAAFKRGDYDVIPSLLSAKNAMTDFLSDDGRSKVEFQDEHILVNGEQLEQGQSNLLLELWYGGHDMQPYVNLLGRLDHAWNDTVFSETFAFMNAAGLHLTPEGQVVAFRKVHVWEGGTFTDALGRQVTKGDFVDPHSRQWRNNVGDVNSMPRRKVNADRNVSCSTGLHFGALHYTTNGPMSGQVIVMVLVDPADIITIPKDYNDQKGRCCRFEVIGVAQRPGEDVSEYVQNLGTVVELEEARKALAYEYVTRQGNTGESFRWTLRRRDNDQEYGQYPSRAKANDAKTPSLYGWDTLNEKRF